MKLVAVLAIALAYAEADFKISSAGRAYEQLPMEYRECAEVGLAKAMAQADAMGVVVDETSLTLEDVDRNLVATYIWWSLEVAEGNDRTAAGAKITVLTQKPAFQGCL